MSRGPKGQVLQRPGPPRPPQAEAQVGGDRGSHAGRRSSESRPGPGRRRRGGQSERQAGGHQQLLGKGAGKGPRPSDRGLTV